MATKTDTAESQFNEFGWHNREVRSGVDQSVGWGLLGKRALTRRVSVAVAGVRLFAVTLLSALLVGCGGDGSNDGSNSGADTAAPQAAPLQEQTLVFTQAGPFHLVVGDTLSNVASGGSGTGVIRYSSNDTTVATVDAAGRLTVVGAGIATITAEKAADTQYAAASADYDVSATPAPQDTGPEPQSIGFAQPGPLNLVVGDTLSNVASGGPGTGMVSYSSSDTTVATVDATTGQLTVVGAGIATITAEKAADAQYTAASASYLVQTTPASQAITFDQPGPLNLVVGDTLSNVASGGAGTGAISYSSSDTAVATVDATGQLTVIGFGTATITAEKAADRQYLAARDDYTVHVPIRVPMTAWVGSTNAQVTVNVPLSAGSMEFFRSNEANCDPNHTTCANGHVDSVIGSQTVEDTAFTLNQVAHYVLQQSGGANQALLTVSAEERSGLRTNANNADFHPREDHEVVVHNNRLWVIGGYDALLPDVRTNDVWWSVDGVTWTEVPNNGERFTPRSGHQAVSFKNKLWVIGGSETEIIDNKPNDVSTDDIWYSEDDGVTWKEVARISRRFSSGRSGHQVVVHKNDVSNEDELWLIGGWDSVAKEFGSDVWRSEDGETWEPVTSELHSDYVPGKGHQLVSYKNQLWLIGYWDHNNQVWRSDNGEDWVRLEGSTDFSLERALGTRHFNNRAVVHNNRLWLIPGSEATRKQSSSEILWTQNGTDWTKEEVDFPRRHLHGFVSYNNRLWVIGGVHSYYKETPTSNSYVTFYRNDVWRSSEDGLDWRFGYKDVFLQTLP